MGRFGPRAEVDAPPREQERKGVTAEEHDTEQESPFCVSRESDCRGKCRVSWFCHLSLAERSPGHLRGPLLRLDTRHAAPFPFDRPTHGHRDSKRATAR